MGPMQRFDFSSVYAKIHGSFSDLLDYSTLIYKLLNNVNKLCCDKYKNTYHFLSAKNLQKIDFNCADH